MVPIENVISCTRGATALVRGIPTAVLLTIAFEACTSTDTMIMASVRLF
jgi:hypothetical protein